MSEAADITIDPGAEKPTTTWRDGLSPDIREHPSVTRYANVEEMAKGLINANELIGRKGIPLPKEGDANDQARFWNALGRPESVDGYDLGDFTPPEGVEVSADLQTAFFQKAHELGLTNAQARGLIEWQTGQAASMVGASQEALASARGEAESTLRKEWGAAYEARLNMASRAMQVFAGEGAESILGLQLADGSALGDNPAFIRIMARASEGLSEADLATDAAIRTIAGHTPESAQQAIREFEANGENIAAMKDRNHIAHAEVMRRREQLYSIAYPDTHR